MTVPLCPMMNFSMIQKKTNHNRLIAMDDVCGLADESKKFAGFLTVASKFNYIIYPEKLICKMILFETNIFNTFSASVSLVHARRILESICIRKTIKCILQLVLWISRLFTELPNRNVRVCLTLDCSGTNKD